MRRGATFSLMCLALGLATSGQAGAADLGQVQLTESETGTHVVLDIDGLAGYKFFTLHGPERLVVDVEGGRLAPRYRTPAPNGAVASVRTGQSNETLRVVFDLGMTVEAQTRI